MSKFATRGEVISTIRRRRATKKLLILAPAQGVSHNIADLIVAPPHVKHPASISSLRLDLDNIMRNQRPYNFRIGS